MRLTTLFVAVLAAEGTLASSWFSKAVYNKWHETELERWLSDHNVPYPTPADRKDLENLVKENWNSKVAQPYQDWDVPTLQKYLSDKGAEAKYATEKNKETLVQQVQKSWYETADKAGDTYGDVKSWIFDTWDESSLKAFGQAHGILPKEPTTTEKLLDTVKSNYDAAASKAGETAQYPGNWIYAQYTESNLKKWLDERGYPVPQPSSRDKLISAVRRNSYLAHLKYRDAVASASASAAAAQATLTDKLIESWSDSQLKEFLDKNNIPVPQGSKKNELQALIRKYRADLTGDSVSGTVVSAYGAATSKAGNEYAKATDSAALMYEEAFDKAVDTWTESRLKAYLDSRGVPTVPHTTLEDLRAKVRLHKHKAATGYTAWTFDTWTVENLQKWLQSQGQTVNKKAAVSRDELASQASAYYASVSSAGGNAYASVTSALAAQTDAAKDVTFDTWSESDLKKYLDQYGIPNYQGSNVNELRALARRQYTFFKYGTSSPGQTILAKIQSGAQSVIDYVRSGVANGFGGAETAAAKASDKAKPDL